MHGTKQTVGISSYPSNADVWVDNNYIGKSPTVVELRRKDNHIVRIELKGYTPYETTLTHKLSGWVFGNFVIGGGFIGLAVDAISGGLYKLTPEQVEVEMKKGSYATAPKGDEVFIAAVLKADPSWEKIGNLTPVRE